MAKTAKKSVRKRIKKTDKTLTENGTVAIEQEELNGETAGHEKGVRRKGSPRDPSPSTILYIRQVAIIDPAALWLWVPAHSRAGIEAFHPSADAVVDVQEVVIERVFIDDGFGVGHPGREDEAQQHPDGQGQ